MVWTQRDERGGPLVGVIPEGIEGIIIQGEVWQDCQGDLPEQGRIELGPSWGRASEIKVWL